MYPKSHPAGSPDLRKSMEDKKQQKREQLAALLINKFRNKYRINLANEKELDDLVQKSVSEMIRKDNTMCEKNLRELDQRIANQVEVIRGPTRSHSKPASKAPTDALSCRSKKSSALSQAGANISIGKSHSSADINKKLMAMTHNKGMGMTETQWNQIVLKNVADEQNDVQKRKDRIAQERAEMKAELMRQVEIKRELQDAQRRQEKHAFSRDIVRNEQRMAEEEARMHQIKN
jgi:hypothetical protein